MSISEEQNAALVAENAEQKERIEYLAKISSDALNEQGALFSEEERAKAAAQRDMEDRMTPLPGVKWVQGVAGRYIVGLQMPSGVEVNAALGTVLPNGMKVTAVNAKQVGVKATNGREYVLPFGNAYIPTPPRSESEDREEVKQVGNTSDLPPSADPLAAAMQAASMANGGGMTGVPQGLLPGMDGGALQVPGMIPPSADPLSAAMNSAYSMPLGGQ